MGALHGVAFHASLSSVPSLFFSWHGLDGSVAGWIEALDLTISMGGFPTV